MNETERDRPVAAIVLAAGKGTRMRSERSKLLHPLLGESLVSYPLRALVKAGIQELVVVLGHQSSKVRKEIESFPFLQGKKLFFVEQVEQQGTGHAVQVAFEQVNIQTQEVLIVCGDSPHLETVDLLSLLRLRREKNAPISVLGAEIPIPQGYGRLMVDSNVKEKLQKIVEERDADEEIKKINWVNTGVYAALTSFVRAHIGRLLPHNAQQERYLTDLIACTTEAYWTAASKPYVAYGVNSQAELMQASSRMQRMRIEQLQEQGVSIMDPHVVIGPEVHVSPSVIIEHGVTLLGNTCIEEGACIEHHVHLKNVYVGKNSRIRAFTYAEDASIGASAQVGPMARLRADSVLEEEAEVGNFCEVKKTRIRKKAKAHHVSYLGDADIGERTNIGAGTIICNYNGRNKPFSSIGSDVFIGSNSTLVAPVKIDAHAYVAAGSTITEPVPREALAFGRSKQVNKENYVSRLHDKLASKK